MDALKEWVLALCACAAVLSLAEVIMPEGAVKKTAYFVLSLVAVSSLISPLRELKSISFDIDDQSVVAPSGDWVLRTTSDEFSYRVATLIGDVLKERGVSAKKIDVSTDIADDGSVYITKARITVDRSCEPRIDEISAIVEQELEIKTDVIIG